MSDQPKAPFTNDQKRAIITKMFQATHADMGAVIRMLTSNPTPKGYLLATEAVGECTARLTRAMGALEKMIEMNSQAVMAEAPVPAATMPVTQGQTLFKPVLVKDDALVGTFVPAPPSTSPPGPVLTPAAQADFDIRQGRKNIEAAAEGLSTMVIGSIKTSTDSSST